MRKNHSLTLVKCRRYPRFAVIGAGHGGQAMAGHLALLGFPVILYNKSPHKLDAIRRQRGVWLEGYVEGFGRIDAVTTEIGEAVSEADILMVVVPACGHRAVARAMAPHLRDGQVVVLNPGRTGGAIDFENTLWSEGCHAGVTVAEAQTLIYASRAEQPGRAHIFRIKRRVPVAALPADRTPEVVALLQTALPQFTAAAHVLETSLNNIGSLFHPAPVLLNAGRIEQGETFDYYHAGITPAVARVLEEMDRERCAVAAAFGVQVQPAQDWLREAYGAEGEDLRSAILNNPAYAGITSPRDLQTRYLYEDVPTGLVPIASLGDLVGVETPTLRSVAQLASVVHGTDYWAIGRTAQNLGLGGMDADQFYSYILEGRKTA